MWTVLLAGALPLILLYIFLEPMFDQLGYRIERSTRLSRAISMVFASLAIGLLGLCVALYLFG